MTQTLHNLSMLWLPGLGGILVPGAFASACGHCPSCPCPPLLGQRQKENPAFPTRKRIPWSACHCSCFQPGPARVTVV